MPPKKQAAPAQKPEQHFDTFDQRVDEIAFDIAEMLKEKNASYGNSALDPVRIFSKVDAEEQIKVRLDDKLSRIARGSEYPGDDTVKDTIGYLFLLLLAKGAY